MKFTYGYRRQAVRERAPTALDSYRPTAICRFVSYVTERWGNR